jgi:ribosomal protein S18 acetylase RimI-like enzyme
MTMTDPPTTAGPRVEPATEQDVPGWLALAAEVGDLFGSDMAGNPAFRDILLRGIAAGTAYCVHIGGEVAGAMLLKAGSIDWLAVSKRHRRRGVGRALVAHAQAHNSELRVTTFGVGHPHADSQAARTLYRRLGFRMRREFGAVGTDGTPREELVWRGAQR